MTTTQTEFGAWMEALVESSRDLATNMLGLSGCTPGDARHDLSQNMAGSYIALVGDESSYQFGIVSTQAANKQLAGHLLGMEPEESDELNDDDIADALSEVVNIVAGGVKVRMAEHDPGLRLGLPLFIHGHIRPTEHQEMRVLELMLGDIPAELFALRQLNG